MGDRFGRYSKYIIQERALPDIRDGLKPVQRRILFSMNKDGNTFDKAYRKSAKSVGNVMGNFHPHGDSSIYDAMVRMSQDWKMREELIEMHGNNGSMDGDPSAAMRYTEARLSEIANQLLEDIDKETVPFIWNFDDTEKEPTVLPAKYPNLLVNGSTGISAGYATEIPPHNLAEIIDGTIYLIDHETAALDQLLAIVHGPDFPTGAIIQGADEIKRAYETGKGKIVVRSKTAIETIKGGKQQIVATEIPFEVNKAVLVKKMDEIRVNRKIDGIAEVRDESDRDGLRVVVELKKEADAETILNYLFKYTDLQINYNFNMVAIDEGTPKQVGLIKILKSYIKHQKSVIVKRSQFDLYKANKRLHIVEGLIKVIDILDEVIAIIRSSDNKGDSKANLIAAYEFTEAQAEAIVTLQLYRLSNTDILALEKEYADLQAKIKELKAIINDETTLLNVLKKELRQVKAKFKSERRSVIQAEVAEIKIEAQSLIAEEEVVVSVTKQGYIKRTSLRSFNSSVLSEIGRKEDDVLFKLAKASTLQHILIFTNFGNVWYKPIHELTDLKWKEVGTHLSQNISNYQPNEEVVAVEIVSSFEQPIELLFVTHQGMIKRVKLSDFSPWRTYRSKMLQAIKLKGTSDSVILATPILNVLDTVMIATAKGYALQFGLEDVPLQGTKSAGVKAINLKADDYTVSAFLIDAQVERLMLLTQRGNFKVFNLSELPITSRANRGLLVLKELKNKPHRLFMMNAVEERLHFETVSGRLIELLPDTYRSNDRISNGSSVIDELNDIGIKRILPIIEAVN
ncbi:DNA topoisomerase IV subunit A [Enterococcus sp. MMGLQ5-2]|nr:DNA topoisomerase IV subunit A [Enterococcus sp. MMGLQ5-2]MBS7583840.1 DNA topoisomerase IV subunit A [Enterococcus sp. MMGLQ5-1]NPD11701.1 DNA topoisomerase IV subunit A [Enterococcus sp. MMGLQ5-1]NPD36510.1 DNA topoisomerase IV subunit A [Enterococcus sp. MMGLQ5-2]